MIDIPSDPNYGTSGAALKMRPQLAMNEIAKPGHSGGDGGALIRIKRTRYKLVRSKYENQEPILTRPRLSVVVTVG